jgi:hypothetical protein
MKRQLRLYRGAEQLECIEGIYATNSAADSTWLAQWVIYANFLPSMKPIPSTQMF